ncbi:MAG: hypothetical protein HOP23_05675 [Methylococcaceae bacterium]|nr:hypothetical protein [Methylococcaceae bacterium]
MTSIAAWSLGSGKMLTLYRYQHSDGHYYGQLLPVFYAPDDSSLVK